MNPLAADLALIAEHTQDLWEELRGQRLFLTGGTGFFGSWLVESFCYINQALSLDARITILTRDPESFATRCPHLANDPSVTLHKGDVRSFSFPDGEFRYVIHAATEARARQAREAPLEMLTTMVAGTQRVLEFAASHGTRKFLLTSSGAVYGTQPPDLSHVPEDYPGAPDPMNFNHLYGEGKRISELLGTMFHCKFGLECKIARCWAFCGPYLPLDEHFAMGNFIGDVLAGRPIQIQGDGTPRRSYLYAADLMEWLWTILFKAPALVPLNVGSSRDISILELAKTVAATLNPATKISVAKTADPNVLPMRYVPCIDRAKAMLGLQETVSLEESILRTARWYGYNA